MFVKFTVISKSNFSLASYKVTSSRFANSLLFSPGFTVVKEIT